jgi:hypothetical protein
VLYLAIKLNHTLSEATFAENGREEAMVVFEGAGLERDVN